MPTPQFSLPGGDSPEALRDYIIKLQRDLQYLLVNLDDLNISRLNASVIIANTITADKMDVTELSAISANLGTITAGLMQAVTIIGSYIATANGTYPRVELDSVSNFLAALASATDKLTISPSSGGVPGVVFQSLLYGGVIQLFSNQFQILSTSGTDLIVGASGGALSLSGSSVSISTGASGSFTTVDGKTVTVTNGVVTSIV